MVSCKPVEIRESIIISRLPRCWQIKSPNIQAQLSYPWLETKLILVAWHPGQTHLSVFLSPSIAGHTRTSRFLLKFCCKLFDPTRTDSSILLPALLPPVTCFVSGLSDQYDETATIHQDDTTMMRWTRYSVTLYFNSLSQSVIDHHYIDYHTCRSITDLDARIDLYSISHSKEVA